MKRQPDEILKRSRKLKRRVDKILTILHAEKIAAHEAVEVLAVGILQLCSDGPSGDAALVDLVGALLITRGKTRYGE